MFKIIIYIFSVIGLFSISYFTYSIIIKEKEAKEYCQNCKKIKVGMTIEVVKEIMGDSNWQRKKTKSEIWIVNNKIQKSYEYFLDYPSRFGSSQNPMIFFNPKTGRTTKIICGE